MTAQFSKATRSGVASKCTHIVTSRGLSSPKTHKILTAKSCKVHVVKPGWILDSVAFGKRRPERFYAILATHSSKGIHATPARESDAILIGHKSDSGVGIM